MDFVVPVAPITETAAPESVWLANMLRLIVAVDALPVQFPYVEKGIVPVLLAQPTFKWGKVSVEKVIDKIQLKKAVPAVNEMKLIRVSKENLGGWARQLRAWGYADVPDRYLTYEAE